MKKNIESNLFIFNLYSQPKDYFSQKTTKEHNDRFNAPKNVLKLEKINEKR